MDIVELVRSQDIAIISSKREDKMEEFLGALEGYKKDLLEESGRDDKAGICLRWVLSTVRDSREIILMAQVNK